VSEPAPSRHFPPADAASITYWDDLAEVRQFVRGKAVRAGLSPSRSGDLVIAVSELAANTLRHTAGCGVLRLWTMPGEVLCQVRDGGQLSDARAGRVRPPVGAGGGYGLWVVRQLCDAVDISTGPCGTTICVHMHLGG
jgi:anti-sigma regulatory factor (Ser/Thr protein kinase)